MKLKIWLACVGTVSLVACGGGGSGNGNGGNTAPPTQAAAITQTRNLVIDVRTTVQTQENLKAPLQSFANQVNATVLITQPQSRSLHQSLSEALNDAAGFYSAQSGIDGSKTITTQDDSGNTQNLNLRIANSGGNTTVTETGNFRNEAINLSVMFTSNPQQAATSTLTGTIVDGGQIATTGTGPGDKLVFNSGSLTINKSDTNPIAHNNSNIASGHLAVDATLSQQNLPSGQNPVSFVGSLSADAVQCTAQTCKDQITAGNGAVFTPSNFDLKGTFTQPTSAGATSTVDAELKATLASPAEFDPDKPISGNNVPAGTAELTFNASNIPNVPDTAVDLQAKLTNFYQSSNGQDSTPIGTVTATFTQGGSELLSAQVTSTAPASGSGAATIVVDITDSKGSKITINNPFTGESSNDIGQATVDGTVAGTISKSVGGVIIITYADGSFESLFN